MNSAETAPFAYCAIISLPQDHQRRDKAQASAPYPLEHLPAVRGADLSPGELAQLFDVPRATRRYGRAPKAGEIGCTLSHLQAYREFLARTEDPQALALIVEDDVEFLPGSKAVLDALAQEPHGFTLLFSNADRLRNAPSATVYPRALDPQHEIRSAIPYPLTAIAYIISRAAAEKLVQRAERGPVDWFADESSIYVEEHISFRMLTPGIACEGEASKSSAIHSDYISLQQQARRSPLQRIKDAGLKIPRMSLRSPLTHRIWHAYYKVIQALPQAIREHAAAKALTKAMLAILGTSSFIESRLRKS
ncbi:glycosyltransferase family 25 protein [Corynebacterium gerontici]|uniref:Glycosyltransferase family 25 (LPS biosynthesis protein) n=1 Tax=Corynebacterium gerontici TaxID=2079234 RepID=A0A3G6IXZ4_9CORY|nr:glycosyltransferase family 25 protein [Corynebacterium gerontici]AZA10433.1 Glycosyltransferase family 25 (LPS biosynthesis protein) [Corynebacterium gerontici]